MWWRKTFYSCAVVAAFSLAASGPLASQPPCEDALRQAQKSYEMGLFEDVPGQLAPCLGGARTSRATAIQVHSLLARIYLASDDLDKAREEVSNILRIDPEFEPEQSTRFSQLVVQVRREEATVQVAAVSKTKESLREAPATVVVVTGDEIERRGYLDLEQLLYDLPGFDIARTNGEVYSNIYQRGIYTRYSDRTLLLLDGVEQNSLGTNSLFLSRQYSLHSIDRVEVIYGPASTMYGNNAYTGVINIVTKEPEALLPADKNYGVTVQAASGGFDARLAEITLAGRNQAGSISWLVDGHFYSGNEVDLSRFENWDYNYDSVPYRDVLRLTGAAARDFGLAHPCAAGASPYYECTLDGHGQVTAIELTAEGERLARDLDRRFIQENQVRFDDRAKDWFLRGEVRFPNMVLGLDLSRTNEGVGSNYRDLFVDGRGDLALGNSSLYLKYSRPVGRDLTLNAFTRYQQIEVDEDSSQTRVLNLYANSSLRIWNLVPPCLGPNDPVKPAECPEDPWFRTIDFGGFANQIRSELSLVYEPSGKLNGVAGLELGRGSIGQFDQVATGPGGVTLLVIPPEQIEHTDVGLYAQTSYKLRSDLRFVLAGRLSHNEINNKKSASGFGTLFTPRAAVVYAPGRLVLKAIYSEAFKDPSDLEKFGIVLLVFNFPSGGLRPERVKNFELSAGWQPTEDLSLEAGVYQANYTDVVALRPIQGCNRLGCAKLQNHDRLRIRGLQATARYRAGRAELWGNYTLTEPFQTNPDDGFGGPLLDDNGQPVDELPVGEISRHRVNLGVDLDGLGKLALDLRARYVGPRRTGRGTTVSDNPLGQIPSYATADAALTYRSLLPGATLQLVIDNLFDHSYVDPGRDVASHGSPVVPQPGRTVFLRVIYSPWRNGPDERHAKEEG